MRVVIQPVLLAESGSREVEFDLPGTSRAGRVAGAALERHPFRSAAGKDLLRDPDGARVRMEVAVGDEGGCRAYRLGTLGAEIRYDPYLESASSPVELALHLRCYMGEPVEPRPRGGVPAAEDLVRHPFDEAGLRRTLWHEYGHLLDALRPGFGYERAAKAGLSAFERGILNELWNAHIDRRLANLAPETDAGLIRRLPRSRAALEEMLRRIWEEPRDWTYPELVRVALELPPR
jgi:hypothetical protein